MKYRLKKDLLWLKAGEIVETDVNGFHNSRKHKTKLDGDPRLLGDIHISLEDYPDFFEPISEEDEKDQEDIKRLESRGYYVGKIGIDLGVGTADTTIYHLLSKKVDSVFSMAKQICPCISMGMFKICPHK